MIKYLLLLTLLVGFNTHAMTYITDDTFYKKVSGSKGLAVVDFSADWCGGCQKLKPVLEKIEKDYPNVTFFYVDSDKSPKAGSYFSVRYIPHVLLFKDGGNLGKVEFKNYTEPEVRKALDEAIKNASK